VEGDKIRDTGKYTSFYFYGCYNYYWPNKDKVIVVKKNYLGEQLKSVSYIAVFNQMNLK